MALATQDQSDKEVTIPADPSSFDRGALEASVSAKMSDVFKDSDDELVESEPSTEVAKTSEEAETTAEEKPEAEVKTAPTKETPAPAAGKAPAEKPAVETNPAVLAIPAAYRRSMKAYQWTDDEIDAAAKANPTAFAKMAEKVHLSRVEETQRWTELGRHAKAATPAPAAVEPPKFDVKALRAKYGNEPFIDAMEAQHSQLEATRAFMDAAQKRQADNDMATLVKQIDNYFSSEELSPYHDHYGKGGQTLTEAQLTARGKVLSTADLLIAGARSMGRPMTLDEALTMAHDSVASPIAAKVAVKKIETQVVQRQAAISLRPGSRGSSAPIANDRKGLEKKVGEGLAKVFARR